MVYDGHAVAVFCREDINMEETERNLIGEMISPLLKQGSVSLSDSGKPP